MPFESLQFRAYEAWTRQRGRCADCGDEVHANDARPSLLRAGPGDVWSLSCPPCTDGENKENDRNPTSFESSNVVPQ